MTIRANRSARIMAGQRAGACGLAIAGLSLMAACRIVGAPYLALKATLPPAWHTRARRRCTRWIGEELAQLEGEWNTPGLTTAAIGRRHGVSAKAVQLVARRHGWPRRKRRRLAEGTGFGELSAGQRRTFFKLRRAGVARAAALAAAVGVGP